MFKKRYIFQFVDKEEKKLYHGFITAKSLKQAKKFYNTITNYPFDYLYVFDHNCRKQVIGYITLDEGRFISPSEHWFILNNRIGIL